MKTKTWEAVHKDNRISVTNEWDWSGNTTESISINGELVQSRTYNVAEVSSQKAMGNKFEIPYGQETYTVTLGSAWHCLGMACRIEANGERIGGDKIVLFGKTNK